MSNVENPYYRTNKEQNEIHKQTSRDKILTDSLTLMCEFRKEWYGDRSSEECESEKFIPLHAFRCWIDRQKVLNDR